MSDRALELFLLSYKFPTETELEAYFKNVKYRGCFFVEMKKQLAAELMEKNKYRITKTRIAEIFGNKHSTVCNWFNRGVEPDKRVKEIVKMNAFIWVQKGLYPITKHEKNHNADLVELKYKLVTLGEWEGIDQKRQPNKPILF